MDSIELLFAKFARNECSAEELEQLLKHFAGGNDEQELKSSIKKQLSQSVQPIDHLDLMVEEVFENIKHKINTDQVKTRPRFNIYRYAAAAMVLLSVCAGFWVYFANTKQLQQLVQHQQPATAIVPGSNKAFLTLNNGTKINLTSASNGALAKEAGIEITKTADGQLLYKIQGNGKTGNPALYNTIETPKGGQYQIQLPDGTKVWLNAVTTLKYALNFASAKERRVELEGEAYFEVAKDKLHPFKVISKKQEVEVFGTHFNVNAYTNEPEIKTTLLEGSVQVVTTDTRKERIKELLKPGQQSILALNKMKVVPVDAEAEVTWKNGRFTFANEPIEQIMRKIARWYDVEIVYKGDMKEKVFAGTLSRYANISNLLNAIAATNTVHFKIEGRRVIVMD